MVGLIVSPRPCRNQVFTGNQSDRRLNAPWSDHLGCLCRAFERRLSPRRRVPIDGQPEK